MIKRPWVTPQEVKEYTELEEVRERADGRLKVDISRAEQYVIAYTHNTFSEYENIPDSVKTAVMLLAEAYGFSAVVSLKGIKSETFDDYSYTAENGGLNLEKLGLAALLDEFVIAKPKNGVNMRLRRL